MNTEDEMMQRVSSIMIAAVSLAAEMAKTHIENERVNHKNSDKWLEQYREAVDRLTDRYCIGDKRDEAVMKDIADHLLTFANRIAEAKHG